MQTPYHTKNPQKCSHPKRRNPNTTHQLPSSATLTEKRLHVQAPDTIIPRLATIPHEVLVTDYLFLSLDLLDEDDPNVVVRVGNVEMFLQFLAEREFGLAKGIFVFDFHLDPS
jgi:hypothetical protein